LPLSASFKKTLVKRLGEAEEVNI